MQHNHETALSRLPLSSVLASTFLPRNIVILPSSSSPSCSSSSSYIIILSYYVFFFLLPSFFLLPTGGSSPKRPLKSSRTTARSVSSTIGRPRPTLPSLDDSSLEREDEGRREERGREKERKRENGGNSYGGKGGEGKQDRPRRVVFC